MSDPVVKVSSTPPVQILTPDGVKTAPQYDLRYFLPAMMDSTMQSAMGLSGKGNVECDWQALKMATAKLGVDPDAVMHALACYVRTEQIISSTPAGIDADAAEAAKVAGYDKLPPWAHILACALLGRSLMAMAFQASRSEVTGRAYAGMAKEVLTVKKNVETFIGKQDA